jgi:hypothetical protein
MICHAPSKSEEERDALRTFIEEATIGAPGYPQRLCRMRLADRPIRLPIYQNCSRATLARPGSNSMTKHGQR